jgi:hypothetical protein
MHVLLCNQESWTDFAAAAAALLLEVAQSKVKEQGPISSLTALC